MNRKQLQKLGLPPRSVKAAQQALSRAAQQDRGFGLKGRQARALVESVLASPATYQHDTIWGALAQELLFEATLPAIKDIDYPTWGDEIDAMAHQQMRAACRLPCAVSAALMPDAHVGYGLPIGGVLACDNAVVPYAVGVDIACRMKLSVFDLPAESLQTRHDKLATALEQGTRFGVGSEHQPRQDHEVLDRNWNCTRITRDKKDVAWRQLGTSGSGNHFVEFGTLTLAADDPQLGIAAGEYLALMSHSGSRGAGAAVCNHYSTLAKRMLPRHYDEFAALAWLSLDSDEGQEYWQAMNLMGEYAAANHAVIHRLVAELAGARVIAGLENHHNFAWKEFHGGKELIVHRKGATPAAAGEMGVIPGSMGDPAFVVRGKGNPTSITSASHGAGRRMSRRQANDTFRFSHVRSELAQRGITVLSAGNDEVPGVYKDIRQVIAAQDDLVEVVAQFDPRIVKMSGDGSKPED